MGVASYLLLFLILFYPSAADAATALSSSVFFGLATSTRLTWRDRRTYARQSRPDRQDRSG